MSEATVRIPTPLRPLTGGADEVKVEGATVRDALAALGARHAGILPRILTDAGEARPFVNIYVGAKNVKTLDGLGTPLEDGDVLSIIPAVAGGSAKDRRLAELKKLIPEVDPAEAEALRKKGAILIDVREPDEVAQGSPIGAERIVRGFLELKVEGVAKDPKQPILCMCAGGVRSLFAAEGLRQMGYENVRSVRGGFTRWKQDAQPFEVPRSLDADERERFARHLSMPEVGEKGQMKLLDAKVLCIGAGGLGSPVALYLAAAGVGTIGIIDDDVVDRTNLQRQILHTDARVGEPKVESARATLTALWPRVKVKGYRTRLTSKNVDEVFAGWDVVVDGSDNFPTRYLVNDACVKHHIPNVHGSIFRFEGQATVFWPDAKGPSPLAAGGHAYRRGPCYRCLYPEPPPPEMAPSCAEAGVLGVLPGIVGCIEAVETVKIILGIGDPLVGRLLAYDALRQRFTELTLEADPSCAYCAPGAKFPGYVDYAQVCGTAPAPAAMAATAGARA